MTPGEIPRLHVVTDDAVLAGRDFPEAARAVMDAGGPHLALHVRGPHTTGRAVYEIVERLRPAADSSGALLVVNDRIDVALALDVGGVHLGTRSLDPGHARRLLRPDARIGRSTHGVDAAEEAGSTGADYVFLGNVYATSSHPGREGLGLDVLEEAVDAAAPVPLLAIGGVDVGRVGEIAARGAYGVAVLGGVWRAASPADAARDYISALGG